MIAKLWINLKWLLQSKRYLIIIRTQRIFKIAAEGEDDSFERREEKRREEKPKTLLVNPNWLPVEGSVWDSISSIMPPLGLAWLAATLEQHSFPVSIKDFMAEQNSFEDDIQFIKSQKIDYLGITSTTPQINAGLVLAKASKEANRDSIVILGGVHPTVMPNEILMDNSVV
ncbi:hypothetical protein FACS1894167_09240 [Synergistales bacterium]|nr:hypothetical protein FACS1894167_09240 [Synergistales bacterium]